jgi:transposase
MEDLVPEDNFYRQVEQCVDLGFVRDLVCHLYSDFGRPSIDPIVFFKLQLIAFFEGVRSERLLMEAASLNLAHRWFTGYDLDESVPDHSSLSKIRERYGIEIFQQFFEKIVELCLEAGLVWGEELYFDSTKVDANAAINSMIDRTESEADHHLEELWMDDEKDSSNDTLQGLVEKYNGERFTGTRKPSCKRITDEKVSLTDPDAIAERDLSDPHPFQRHLWCAPDPC